MTPSFPWFQVASALWAFKPLLHALATAFLCLRACCVSRIFLWLCVVLQIFFFLFGVRDVSWHSTSTFDLDLRFFSCTPQLKGNERHPLAPTVRPCPNVSPPRNCAPSPCFRILNGPTHSPKSSVIFTTMTYSSAVFLVLNYRHQLSQNWTCRNAPKSLALHQFVNS